LMYSGVVLGGTSLEKKKRHPTLRNNVIIGAGAIVLGAINIGDNARIGAGSVVVTDVPPNATAVGVPGRIIGMGFSAEEIQVLELGKLPEPIADAIRFVMKEQEKLKERIKKLEKLEKITKHVDKRIEKRKKEIESVFFSKSKEEFSKGEGI